MADRYRWDDTDMQTLRDATQTVYDALVQAAHDVGALTEDMKHDTAWAGDHKKAFMAWMDLLQQYHALLAAPYVVKAAVGDLDKFLSALRGYYENSAAYASLEGVG